MWDIDIPAQVRALWPSLSLALSLFISLGDFFLADIATAIPPDHFTRVRLIVANSIEYQIVFHKLVSQARARLIA